MSYTNQFRRRLKPLVKTKNRGAIKRLFLEYASRAADKEMGEGAIEELRQILREEWYGKRPPLKDSFTINLD